jgi:hypothetical protein
VNLRVRGKRLQAWAIKVRHVHYPEKAWIRFAHGKPYDFNCLNHDEHPLHTAAGAKAFIKKVSKRRMKIGDIVYCTKRRRWYCVDVAAL